MLNHHERSLEVLDNNKSLISALCVTLPLLLSLFPLLFPPPRLLISSPLLPPSAAALPEQLTEQLTEQQCDAEAVKEKLVCQREELELTWFTLKRDAELAWQK